MSFFSFPASLLIWFNRTRILNFAYPGPKLLIMGFIFTMIFMASGCRRTKTFYQEGVSLELATYRARQIYDVKYDLHFIIPQSLEESVKGNAIITFKTLKAMHGVILDFQPGEEYIHSLMVNGVDEKFQWLNGHIFIDGANLVPRQDNVVEISFTASDQALNRSPEFMYTLFVPDRASTAFPCFDQPDLKAPFSLQLTIPSHWNALANGNEESVKLSNNTKTIFFAADQPISTYLFAFAAGDFQIESFTDQRHAFRVFHRETDTALLQRNLPEIFRLHGEAIDWMEAYTGIDYPYAGFDMALLPGFQYSGMEHPGAVWYRDARLLLHPSASLDERISKASLIAHETAHMWFGNLVTMKWFDDVWLKEVFAGFMADKMMEEAFPEVNHSLQFVTSHFPRAMAVDRSKGTHPIRQELSNMKLAGTLYGAIIYNKAPIVFEQLEKIMGPASFQGAIREYLLTFSHSNADWDQLVTILDKHTDKNINQWSRAWVYGQGLPEIGYRFMVENQQQGLMEITQVPTANNRVFPQQWLAAITTGEQELVPQMIWLEGENTKVKLIVEGLHPTVILNGQGLGYGYFRMNDHKILAFMDNSVMREDDNLLAAAYINLYENFLQGNLHRTAYFDFLMEALSREDHPLLVRLVLRQMEQWCLSFPWFGADVDKVAYVEDILWQKLHGAPADQSEMYFETWMKLSRSPQSAVQMRELYLGERKPAGLNLSDNMMTQLALEAAMRSADNRDLLQMEKDRIENVDRKRRLVFILPALSPDENERDTFFEHLKTPENRRPEPWVLDALYFLHHPLHPGQGKRYIRESLEMLPEIQATGDIFFPLNWLQATLQNYSDPDVYDKVMDYLESTPELAENLRLKVLQAADMLQRSSGLAETK